MRWNIESKIDARFPDRTASVETFVKNQHAVFAASPYKNSITVSNPFDFTLFLTRLRSVVPELRLEVPGCHEGWVTADIFLR